MNVMLYYPVLVLEILRVDEFVAIYHVCWAQFFVIEDWPVFWVLADWICQLKLLRPGLYPCQIC